jgi:hypothetical protein
LRVFLILVIFAIFCWGFWKNNQRFTYELNAEARLEDKDKLFTPEQYKEIASIITRLDKKYSIKLYVRVRKDLFTTGDAVNKGILVGFSPGKEQMAVFLPPLFRNALGETVVAQMREMVMSTGFDQQSAWTRSAVKSLLFLEAHLDRLNQ